MSLYPSIRRDTLLFQVATDPSLSCHTPENYRKCDQTTLRDSIHLQRSPTGLYTIYWHRNRSGYTYLQIKTSSLVRCSGPSKSILPSPAKISHFPSPAEPRQHNVRNDLHRSPNPRGPHQGGPRINNVQYSMWSPSGISPEPDAIQPPDERPGRNIDPHNRDALGPTDQYSQT